MKAWGTAHALQARSAPSSVRKVVGENDSENEGAMERNQVRTIAALCILC